MKLLLIASMLFCGLASKGTAQTGLAVYKSSAGSQWFAYNPASLGKELYFSKDGKNFQKLVSDGFDGTRYKHRNSYYNPVTNDSGQFDFNNGRIVKGRVTFRKT